MVLSWAKAAMSALGAQLLVLLHSNDLLPSRLPAALAWYAFDLVLPCPSSILELCCQARSVMAWLVRPNNSKIDGCCTFHGMGAVRPWHVVVLGLCCLLVAATIIAVTILATGRRWSRRPPDDLPAGPTLGP